MLKQSLCSYKWLIYRILVFLLYIYITVRSGSSQDVFMLTIHRQKHQNPNHKTHV